MQILCATDFSELSVRAADVAAALGRILHLPLHLVHSVLDWPMAADAVPIFYQTDTWREQLEAEAKRLRATGVEVTSEVRDGAPHLEVVAAAAERPTKIIIIGSTGLGMAERWLLGSVAERVTQSAPVATLVVRDPDSLLAWLRDGKPLLTLCAVDFNLSSDAALVALKDLHGIGHLELEVVHLREVRRSEFISLLAGASRPEETKPSAEVELGRDVWDRVAHVLGDPPAKVHVSQVTRHADHEVARLAEERHAGLVVMGTHQRHGWQRLVAHSFSRGVLAHASTNVLCVPIGPYVPAFEVPIIRRVLVATNFSTSGHDDLRHAFGLVSGGGEIHILHVVPAPEPGINPLVRSMSYLASGIESKEARAAAQGKLDELLRALPAHPNIHVTAGVVIHEHAAVAICEAAERFGADVICVGTRERPSADAATLGPVPHGVITRARSPVMIVPRASV
ncbi:MAG: universal stress protein [Verrucomicrobia bacterium]|nr:universal stress protein [Verrucomicrobiota bacterium]